MALLAAWAACTEHSIIIITTITAAVMEMTVQGSTISPMTTKLTSQTQMRFWSTCCETGTPLATFCFFDANSLLESYSVLCCFLRHGALFPFIELC